MCWPTATGLHLLVLLERLAQRAVSDVCQVEHVSLEPPRDSSGVRGRHQGRCKRHWDVMGVTGRELGTAWLKLGEGLGGVEGMGRGLKDVGDGREGFAGVLVGTGREFRSAGSNWEGSE